MITCKLYGRFGNQMFQISACIAHALRNNFEYVIPRETINPGIWQAHPFHWLNYHSIEPDSFRLWKERGHNYQEIPLEDNLMLDGYFQSYKYFEDKIDELRKLYNIFEPNYRTQNRIYIHTRRGDYIHFQDKHPILPFRYYLEGIKKCNNKEIIICGDDLDFMNLLKIYLQSELSLEYTIKISDENYIYDFDSLVHAEELIIANSSFSLMAGILNTKSKKIISPDKSQWFGPGNAHLNTDDMIPDNFIQLKY